MRLPDLTSYQLHKIIDDIDLEGVAVPGLRGAFYRRLRGRRTHTVGVYSYGGTELFMAWGYVGEAHCRYTAYRRPDGGWSAPAAGCPAIRTRPGAVVLATGTGEVELPTEAPLSAAYTTDSGSERPACPVGRTADRVR